MKTNTQYFSKEQIEAGEFDAFLKVLMNQAYGKGNRYNDIRIHPEDCGAFSIDWVELPWDGAYGGSFMYVEEDEVIMLERQLQMVIMNISQMKKIIKTVWQNSTNATKAKRFNV